MLDWAPPIGHPDRSAQPANPPGASPPNAPSARRPLARLPVLLADFFANDAINPEPIIWAVTLGQFLSAALLTIILGWKGVANAKEGFQAGAIIGAVMGLAFGLMMYGTMVGMHTIATLLGDTVVSLVVYRANTTASRLRSSSRTSRKASSRAPGRPRAAAGSGSPQCTRCASPSQTGHTSSAHSVTTASTGRTTSSTPLESCPEMSIPTSARTATACGRTGDGSEPAEETLTPAGAR